MDRVRKKRPQLKMESLSVSLGTSTILDDGLFIGAKATSQDAEALRALGVSVVLNVTEDIPNLLEHDEGFDYMRIAVQDNTDASLAPFFEKASSLISTSLPERGVLVHCNMGMSRSCSIVLAYLIQHEDMSLAQALIHLKDRRPAASPNPTFMKELCDLEIKFRGGTPTIDIAKYEQDRFADVSAYLAA